MIGRDGKYAPAPFCKFGQGLFVFSGQCLTSWTEILTHSMSGCNVTGIHFPWRGVIAFHPRSGGQLPSSALLLFSPWWRCGASHPAAGTRSSATPQRRPCGRWHPVEVCGFLGELKHRILKKFMQLIPTPPPCGIEGPTEEKVNSTCLFSCCHEQKSRGG